MENNFFEIRTKGKVTMVPCRHIDDKTVIVSGKWIKMAQVHEEEWIAGEIVENPESFVSRLKQQGLPADVFTFFQKPPDTQPKHSYHNDWDNFAVIRLLSFEDWWEKLPQETRKNSRRSVKRGVTIRTVEVDDSLIQGITEIYNETPIRQGKPFPHYGKDFKTIKKETCTLLDRSQFIGAYYGDELIGFIKLVYLGNIASILNIVSKNTHYDKRPTNALITKTVEICSQKGISHLLYGRYTYGRKTSSPLIEFKKRNGFEEVHVPRFYIPLTLWGSIIVRLRLYRGLLGLLPSSVVNSVINIRSRFYQCTSTHPNFAEDSSKLAQRNKAQSEPDLKSANRAGE
jgi:hypothetical protein